MRIPLVLSCFHILLLCGCPDSDTCKSDGDCRKKEACVKGTCRALCNSNADCRGTETCDDGICLPKGQTSDASPAVDTNPADTQSVDTELVDTIDSGASPDASASDLAATDNIMDQPMQDRPLAIDARGTDAPVSDAGYQDASKADTSAPDTSAPDTSAPDTSAPDTWVPDNTAPDTYEPDTFPPPPISVNIFASRPLTTSSAQINFLAQLQDLSQLPSGGGLTQTNTGLTPSHGVLIAAGGAAPQGYGIGPTAIGLPAHNGFGSFDALITVNAIFPEGADPDCEVLAPFSQFACEHQFEIPSVAIQGNGDLQVKAFSANGQPDDFLLSNILPARRYVLVQIKADGLNPQDPAELVEYNDKLFFFANTQTEPTTVSKLLSYAPETQVLRIVSNTRGNTLLPDHPGDLTVYNGRLYFRANNINGKRKLFVFDDTAGALEQVASTTDSQTKDDLPYNLFVHNNALYFSAAMNYVQNDAQRRLFRFATAPESLFQISNINPVGTDWPNYPTSYNGKLFFNACIAGVDDCECIAKLYRYDPKSNALAQISNTSGDSATTDWPHQLIVYQDELYFVAKNSSHRNKLFALNDTTGQLRQVSNTTDDPATSDAITNPIVFDNRLFFSASNAHGATKLFAYSKSTDTISQISNISGDNTVDDVPRLLTIFDRRLFFMGRDTSQTKLFAYDPVARSIVQISDTCPGGSDYSHANAFVEYGGRLFFSAPRETEPQRLMCYDPVENSISMVARTSAGTDSHDYPRDFKVFANRLFFRSRDAEQKERLYMLCDLSLGCRP